MNRQTKSTAKYTQEWLAAYEWWSDVGLDIVELQACYLRGMKKRLFTIKQQERIKGRIKGMISVYTLALKNLDGWKKSLEEVDTYEKVN